MNRVPATALWMSLGGALWLTSMAGRAAEPNKADGNDASKAATQQRLDAAQRRLGRAAKEVADLSMSLSEEEGAGTAGVRSPKRAMLGILIGTDDDDEDEREEGVEIDSVSPGGGAAEAGLKSGDVVLAINNKVLKRDEDGSARSKLLAVMRAIKPGDKVSVKYNRDGKVKTVDVVTKSVLADRVVVGPRGGRFERFEVPPFLLSTADGILGNAELVPLTPKLGQYFGAEKGLLVVRAPTDHDLDLEDGDVILEIDGRAPNSTSHAMRILSSYQPGEKLTLTVLRKKRKTNIEIVVPENLPRVGLERSLRNFPALSPYRRGINVMPRTMVVPPTPPTAALAPLPPTPPVASAPPVAVIAPLAPPAPPPPSGIELQVVPDDGVEVY